MVNLFERCQYGLDYGQDVAPFWHERQQYFALSFIATFQVPKIDIYRPITILSIERKVVPRNISFSYLATKILAEINKN
jgi:hypothetical protein